MSLLSVHGLNMSIKGTPILRGLSFDLEAGETLGVVGESGSGKTMLGNCLIGMLPPGGKVTSGTAHFQEKDLFQISKKQVAGLQGGEIAMVMQDPFTSLHPFIKIADQIAESIVLHRGKSWSEARSKAIELIDRVGLPEPEKTAQKFPHQLSGGQRQRAVIAIAFACHPKLLIADEPTTALDVTLQAQILRLLKELQREEGTGVILISHNVGVIAAVSDRVGVMYAGQLVEYGSAEAVLRSPEHPYTQALLDSLPTESTKRLKVIGGQPPDFRALPPGCAFAPRCPKRFEKCDQEPHVDQTSNHKIKCWLSSTTSSASAPKADPHRASDPEPA